MQDTFSDLFVSYSLNEEREDGPRCTEISPGDQEKRIVIPSKEREPGLRASHLLTQLQQRRVDKQGGFPWGCPAQTLLCPALTWAHVQNPLANTRVCSRWEQHIPANTHGVLSPLYQGHTCLTHSLKFSQDLFCPPLSTHAWKIPSKARHKTLHGWVLSMSSPGELKCEVSQNMLQDNDVLSRSGRKVVIQASVEQWLPSLSAIDLTAAWGLHGIGRQSPSPRVGNAKWGFHILQLLLTEREGCPENFPVMR